MQKPLPPHSLHVRLILPCVQMSLPPQSLHLRLIFPCGQMTMPPHSLHVRFSFPCGQMALPPLYLHRPSATRAGRWHCQSNTAVFALALLPRARAHISLAPGDSRRWRKARHWWKARRWWKARCWREPRSRTSLPVATPAATSGAASRWPFVLASGCVAPHIRRRGSRRPSGPTGCFTQMSGQTWVASVLVDRKFDRLDSCLAEGEGERAASLVALGVGAAATSSLVSLGGFGETVRSTAVTAAGQDHGTCSTST
jgi:hypothetical protein